MRVLYNYVLNKFIRLGRSLSLIFFACYLLTGCRLEPKKIIIVWENNKAIGISIPNDFLSDLPSTSGLQIKIKDKPTSLLGQFTRGDEVIIFKPSIPLTAGQHYEIYQQDRFIGSIRVSPGNVQAKAPKIVAIYPGADTLPENLLKIYIQFSVPMREGEALQHVHLLDDKSDTVQNVFLDLQPELWDSESTNLTLWLDPGRIKRELIPNQKFGAPLQKGKKYSIVVSGQWKSAQGLATGEIFTKDFITTNRDSVSPQPEVWKLQLPRRGSVEPLNVTPDEALDYFLLQETITILDSRAQRIKGIIKPVENEKSFQFFPKEKWQKGQYSLQVASYLEDLAGNNLERPFDRDIRSSQTAQAKGFFERKFEVIE